MLNKNKFSNMLATSHAFFKSAGILFFKAIEKLDIMAYYVIPSDWRRGNVIAISGEVLGLTSGPVRLKTKWSPLRRFFRVRSSDA